MYNIAIPSINNCQAINRKLICDHGNTEQMVEPIRTSRYKAYETIRYMFDCGLVSYEWLGTNEDWLHAWPLEKHECISVALYPLRPLGLIGLGMDFTHFVRKRIEQKVK